MGASLRHLEAGHSPVLVSEQARVLQPRPHKARDVEAIEHSCSSTFPEGNQHAHKRLQLKYTLSARQGS